MSSPSIDVAARAYVPAPTPGPSNEQIAGYFNIGIWGIIGLCAIATLPRAFARYRHPSAYPHASLRLAAEGNPSATTTLNHSRHHVDRLGSADFDQEKDKGEIQTLENSPETPIERTTPAIVNHPTRAASFAAMFHPVHRVLSHPFPLTNYSIGRAILMTIYTGIICFGILYHNLPSFGPRRAGWLVVGQLPLVFALASKNNFVGFLLGVGYEKLNFWHSWVGKTMFLAGMFHVVGYLVLFSKAGKLVVTIRAQPEGWITFSGLCLLAVVSLPQIRRSVYTLFWHAHWIGYIMMIVGVSFHAEHAWHYATAAAGVLVLDHICRLWKTTFVTATLTAIPELKCTRIEIPHLTRGWRAGQHIRLRAVSAKMGLIYALESHPFTISTVSESASGEGVTLYAKKCGDWTTKLYDVTSGNQPEISATEGGMSPETSTMMRMVVEGPYGGPGHDVFSSFSGAVVVVGGSGITFGLSAVDEIIREAELFRAKTRLIHLVWIVQDPSSMLRLLLVLQTFLDRASRLPDIDAIVSVYYTRAISASLHHTLDTGINLPKNMQLHPGRPNLPSLMNSFVDHAQRVDYGGEKPQGVVIGCCGPEALQKSILSAARSIPGPGRERVGGVEVVEQLFGW